MPEQEELQAQQEPQAQQAEPQQEPQAQQEPQEPANPYQTIIDQQTSQIDALIAQNEKLTAQITKMISSGVQINDGSDPKEHAQSLHGGYGFAKGNVQLSDDDDYSVAALGSLIGKRDV